ncbi:MAG: CpsD/CapB family tyrosine-protein kinase [Desulfobacteraceae bacterium]|nr:MAG: CpsD/CapB family tyrosine-protein kinase [Desulfobacteraceae bacterium]
MARTHEALKRAEEEYQENFLRGLGEPVEKEVSPPPRRAANRDDMEWYDDLKTNLLSRYPNGSIKKILFNGTFHGGGCTTTAVNFSIALARDPKLRVLLVDVNLRTPKLHEVFRIDHTHGLSDLSTNSDTMTYLIKKISQENLSVLTCGGNYSVPVGLFESAQFDHLLKTASEDFDYVILDAPPVPRFSECRVLCAKVDGVILVLQAGQTRKQVALKAKRTLEEAGAKVLGVVLNRRKYYIPELIYRQL